MAISISMELIIQENFFYLCVLSSPVITLPILLNLIYLFMRDIHTEREREREAETQIEEEADSRQGARCGTRSQVSRIMPWAEGSAKLLSHPGCPESYLIIS